MTAKGPLAGVRIIDLSELLPGPYATQLLADLGADVIKVERPGVGDHARTLSAALFSAMNRGKRSLQLDLKRPEGRQVLRRLTTRADVLLEGYRPGVVTRLGIDYESLRGVNSRLIYVSLTGYGQTGPYRDRPGHDLNYLAAAGIIGISGDPEGPPVHDFGVPVGDLAGSIFTALAIVTALLQRGENGLGQYLDVSITDVLVSWMLPRLSVYLAGREAGTEIGKREILTRPAYGVYRTADDKYLTVAALEEHFWTRLVKALELTKLRGAAFEAYASRVARAREIDEILAARFRQETLAHYVRVLAEADVPFSVVPGMGDVLQDPHFLARELFVETGAGLAVRFPISLRGAEPRRHASPGLGDDSRGLLAEIGYAPEEIEDLSQAGII